MGYLKDFELDELVNIAEYMRKTYNGFRRATVKAEVSKAFPRTMGLMERVSRPSPSYTK